MKNEKYSFNFHTSKNVFIPSHLTFNSLFKSLTSSLTRFSLFSWIAYKSMCDDHQRRPVPGWENWLRRTAPDASFVQCLPFSRSPDTQSAQEWMAKIARILQFVHCRPLRTDLAGRVSACSSGRFVGLQFIVVLRPNDSHSFCEGRWSLWISQTDATKWMLKWIALRSLHHNHHCSLWDAGSGTTGGLRGNSQIIGLSDVKRSDLSVNVFMHTPAGWKDYSGMNLKLRYGRRFWCSHVIVKSHDAHPPMAGWRPARSSGLWFHGNSHSWMRQPK